MLCTIKYLSLFFYRTEFVYKLSQYCDAQIHNSCNVKFNIEAFGEKGKISV